MCPAVAELQEVPPTDLESSFLGHLENGHLENHGRAGLASSLLGPPNDGLAGHLNGGLLPNAGRAGLTSSLGPLFSSLSYFSRT